MHVPPKRFSAQMWLLNLMGYKGLSMRELTPYLEGEKTGKVVGITFDDGYQNNLINAAPILKKYNFNATCYLVSERIGETNLWDLDQGITQCPLMNRSEIQEWLNLGLDIGAHTKTHPILKEINEKQAREEILTCKKNLEQIFKVKINDFCYPFGSFNELLLKIVKEAGYTTATTMTRGRALPKSNNLLLPRMPINHHTLLHLFLAKIFTNYENKRQV
jgi:peptidoglycan/xylan/chitin deacetylase (PgdA/CDA1 family)